ncbi:Protein of unknown function [Polaromonas sp. OV174]|uniref:DUF2894 domain-containing protein n=1 Tax=Polaromonas sp. OV174 TaxID=1855300 RepID=UPI0008F449F3|nr:DUF2894 domain-containing protein [Polaromonas sp. OV174]SFC62886.1 Protein of unknown function [Polaromonas sp. OV174]
MSHEPDPVTAIASLRDGGADQFDPVRLHFLEALARRTRDREGAVKRILEDKLNHALAAYQKRFEQTNKALHDAALRLIEQRPDASSDLRRLLESGNFGELRQCVARVESAPQQTTLAQLTRDLSQHMPNSVRTNVAASDAGIGSRLELKSIRYFRDTWSKLSVEKQLAQANEQGPENAGPLNSHQLLLRAFSVMRDISPDYLNRFVSYVDTLLWLDHVDSKPIAKNAADDESGKKRKTSRTR